MATTERVIEGRWQCGQCDTPGILGRHRFCHACGSPREAGEMSFDFGATNADGSSTFETVEDADLLQAAAAGADWHCQYCDGGNRADWTHCTRCGAGADGTRPEPPTKPPSSAGVELADVAKPVFALGGAGGGLFALCTGICSALCGFSAWVNRDLEVTATVAERTWTRVVHVERLRAGDTTGWKDRMPAPGQPPGSGEPLRAGLGAVSDCETLACWPRPPDGAATARVTGHRWERRITTKSMTRRSGSGWKEKMPRAGSMPVAGRGGAPGAIDTSCRRKERTPERCRDVSKQVQCGTTRSCSIQDQGNGFAKEVCTESPKYCTEYEEQCTAAVVDDWCTWTALSWGSPKVTRAEGRGRTPRWPSVSVPADARETRDATYTLEVTPLAGADVTTHTTDETSWAAAAVGQLVFTTDPVRVLDAELQVTGDRVDCEDGLAVGTIGTRDRCSYQLWSWVAEPPLTATGTDAAPAWPDGSLGEDGRERREEWVDVELTWTRDEQVGSTSMKLAPEDFAAWPPGQPVPVVVDSEARFVRFPGEDD
jgi:hypothetical protein